MIVEGPGVKHMLCFCVSNLRNRKPSNVEVMELRNYEPASPFAQNPLYRALPKLHNHEAYAEHAANLIAEMTTSFQTSAGLWPPYSAATGTCLRVLELSPPPPKCCPLRSCRGRGGATRTCATMGPAAVPNAIPRNGGVRARLALSTGSFFVIAGALDRLTSPLGSRIHCQGPRALDELIL